jgi:hypothetical protein
LGQEALDSEWEDGMSWLGQFSIEKRGLDPSSWVDNDDDFERWGCMILEVDWTFWVFLFFAGLSGRILLALYNVVEFPHYLRFACMVRTWNSQFYPVSHIAHVHHP